MPVIEFKQVSKAYTPEKVVINNLDLVIEKGDFVVLLGESGCGKTTILKMINALIPFDNGYIKVLDKHLSDWNKVELRRHIGYVIQQIGLFPHMKVWENVSYVLNIQKTNKAQQLAKAKELLELVGLSSEYLYRYPNELSGGQKQRVGVARALAANPDIILMDEPFGAVDEKTRNQLQDELLILHQRLHKTIVFVTHDIYEAMKLGSKIVIMNQGKIEQAGSKDELVLNPANDFVLNFLGNKGLLSILDNDALSRVYQDILNKKTTLKAILPQLTK